MFTSWGSTGPNGSRRQQVRTEPIDNIFWTDHAACGVGSNVDPGDFFYQGRFRPGSRNLANHVARLRAVCASCPVVRFCDQFAEQTDTKDGFWAGLTQEERSIRRRRKSPETIRLVQS